MPKVIDRRKHEQRLAKILQRANDKQKRAIIASMGSPPRVTSKTIELVQKVATDIRENKEARRLLFLLFIGGIDGMHKQHNLPDVLFNESKANRVH